MSRHMVLHHCWPVQTSLPFSLTLSVVWVAAAARVAWQDLIIISECGRMMNCSGQGQQKQEWWRGAFCCMASSSSYLYSYLFSFLSISLSFKWLCLYFLFLHNPNPRYKNTTEHIFLCYFLITSTPYHRLRDVHKSLFVWNRIKPVVVWVKGQGISSGH